MRSFVLSSSSFVIPHLPRHIDAHASPCPHISAQYGNSQSDIDAEGFSLRCLRKLPARSVP